MESIGAHLLLQWLMATDFGLLPRGNRSGDKLSKERPEQMSPICTAWPVVLSSDLQAHHGGGPAQVQSIGRGWYPCNTALAVRKRPEAGPRLNTALALYPFTSILQTRQKV